MKISPGPTLRVAFDPRLNSLNFLRLVLATSVVVWHSFPLTGHGIAWAPLRQVVGTVGVDGFFTISGFLILSSWMRRPQWRTYLRARALRIFPAFWVCLIVTAFVIAPLSLLLARDGVPAEFVHSAGTYVVKNAALNIFQHGIAGTPAGVPFPRVWDGALWTLIWEFSCYLGVLVLGVVGVLRFRATIPVLFGLAALGVFLTAHGALDSFLAVNGSRFGVLFLAGCMIYRFQDQIPVSWSYVVIAAVLVLLSALMSEYSMLAALPIAYVMIGTGALLRRPQLSMRNDISYGVYIYGFPLQQLLAGTVLVGIGVAPFAVLAFVITVPVAAASWFLLEKPALRRKRTTAPARLEHVGAL